MTAWVIRAGRYGEREQWCLSEGVAGVGWEIPDLMGARSLEDVKHLLSRSPDAQVSAKAAPGVAGQLWALRSKIIPGDTIVMPLKASKRIALGVVAEGYTYRADDEDPSRRHVVIVDWKRDDVPRSALGKDLLFTIGGLATIFKPAKHHAQDRLDAVLKTGIDPDADQADDTISTADDVEGDTDDVAMPTGDAIRDRIRERVISKFREHDFTELIAAILRCHGYTCTVSPPGPDRGVDILCGSGPLGLDSPTIVVECKSGRSQQGAPVARALQGAVSSNRADQGLLVAWGGITRDAEREFRNDRLRLGVWGPEEVLDNLFEVYDRLPDSICQRLPLRQLWVLDDE